MPLRLFILSDLLRTGLSQAGSKTSVAFPSRLELGCYEEVLGRAPVVVLERENRSDYC